MKDLGLNDHIYYGFWDLIPSYDEVSGPSGYCPERPGT